MGPPDKREPKISDNRFERSSLTLNENERFQKEMEKVRVSSTAKKSADDNISDVLLFQQINN